MADLSNRTPAELLVMTKAQLITAILEGQTDSELEVNESKAGLGPIRRVEVTRDRLTGKVLSRKHIDWTYYAGGSVQDIVIREFNTVGQEQFRRRIRHYIDGRQPDSHVEFELAREVR